MSNNCQTNAQKYGRNNPQNSQGGSGLGTTDSASNSNPNSMYTMRSELRRCESERKKTKDDLRKEQHRYRSVEGTKNKLQSEHRQQKSEIENLQAELRRLRGIEEYLHNFAGNFLRPYAQKRGFQLRDDTAFSYKAVLEPMLRDALQAHPLRSEVEKLRVDVHATQEEVSALQKRLAEMQVLPTQNRTSRDQVQTLQTEVQNLQRQLLTNVEKVHVLSDDVFDKDFRNLVAMVKSLSRSVKVTKDTNMLEYLDNRGLLADVHDHHWNTRARKKYFVETWLWSVLLDHVFKTPFTILGEKGAAIADLWGKLFDNKHACGWPSPSILCESWRCTTTERAVVRMHQDSSPGTTTKVEGGSTDGVSAQESNDREQQMRMAVANEISDRLAGLSTTVNFQLVLKVIEASFALGLQMSLQRSRLQITFPNVGNRFDRAQMEPVPDPDGEDAEDGAVAFIVRPGLTKWGDAHGKHFDQRYDIVPALVQLEALRDPVI